MPVFQETSDAFRDQRILPSLELPLPRLSPSASLSSGELERHEVAVIGVSLISFRTSIFTFTDTNISGRPGGDDVNTVACTVWTWRHLDVL